MSNTPETDASRGYALSSHYGRLEGSYLQMDRGGPFVHAEVARKLECERDEARNKMADALQEVDLRAWDFERMKQERDEALSQIVQAECRAERFCQERDEAREERDKMQTELEMWRDGNIMHQIHRDELEKTERERDEAREDLEHWKIEYEIVVSRLCGIKHERDNGIIAEHEIIPVLMKERDEARNDIIGWENKWKFAVDMAARAELERDDALNKIKELNDILR